MMKARLMFRNKKTAHAGQSHGKCRPNSCSGHKGGSEAQAVKHRGGVATQSNHNMQQGLKQSISKMA
eukprot:297223-Pleurochrysis_carterae.AAC.9